MYFFPKPLPISSFPIITPSGLRYLGTLANPIQIDSSSVIQEARASFSSLDLQVRILEQKREERRKETCPKCGGSKLKFQTLCCLCEGEQKREELERRLKSYRKQSTDLLAEEAKKFHESRI